MSRPQELCLDWRAPWHWSRTARPCVHCKTPTNLRDDAQRPSCKVCAELVAASRTRAVFSAYDGGRLG